MTDANRIRLICDPYSKEISYEWYSFNEDKYIPLGSPSLWNDEYIRTTIQNRAYEIVDILNREYNVGNNGLEIVFAGTEDDYNDLRRVISNHFANSNITCIRDSSYYYTSDYVMPIIKEKFSTIKTALTKKDNTTEKIIELVEKYNDTVKPSISLCVIGTYSSGKSSFINSLIGAEILPSKDKPTTARVCKIYCHPMYQIRFGLDSEKILLTFSGETMKSKDNSEIIKQLRDIVNQSEKHDEITHMNRVLKYLNEFENNRHTISNLIEVMIPFISSILPTNEFDFVVYDTPGSNSNSNPQHFDVLKKSLDEQTNAFPILVTTPKNMDLVDNDKLLQQIKKTGASLDTTNAIVVVNMADQIGPTDYKSMCEKHSTCESIITRWKSTQIFYVSSVIAMASKKNDPDQESNWLDLNKYETYEEKMKKFSKDERQLYKLNIVDKSKTEKITEYADSSQASHLYKNSGLEAVEKEIAEYARKYALYNKCSQASAYLDQAIEMCINNIAQSRLLLERSLNEARSRFNDKHTALCKELGKAQEINSEYNKQFSDLMQKDINEFKRRYNLSDDKKDKKQWHDNMTDQWKKLKNQAVQNKTGKEWLFNEIQYFVNSKLSSLIRDMVYTINPHIREFWEKKTEEYKDICLKSVQTSDTLTLAQEQILERAVKDKKTMHTQQMKFNLRDAGIIRRGRIIFWKETFDVTKCCEELSEKFNMEIATRIHYIETENNKRFNDWTVTLNQELTKEICRFNPELKKYQTEIDALDSTIKSKEYNTKLLLHTKSDIDNLLKLQGGNYDE